MKVSWCNYVVAMVGIMVVTFEKLLFSGNRCWLWNAVLAKVANCRWTWHWEIQQENTAVTKASVSFKIWSCCMSDIPSQFCVLHLPQAPGKEACHCIVHMTLSWIFEQSSRSVRSPVCRIIARIERRLELRGQLVRVKQRHGCFHTCRMNEKVQQFELYLGKGVLDCFLR